MHHGDPARRRSLELHYNTVMKRDSPRSVLHKLSAKGKGKHLPVCWRERKLEKRRGRELQIPSEGPLRLAMTLLRIFLSFKQEPSPWRVLCMFSSLREGAYQNTESVRSLLSAYCLMKTVRLTSASVGEFDTTPQIPDVFFQALCMQNMYLLQIVLSD